MRVTPSAGTALLMVAALAACAESPPPLPAPPPMVEMTMREYDFNLHQTVVRPGRVVFVARNEGRLEHEIVVLPLPQDVVGRLEDELRSPEERAVSTLTQLPAQRPGGVTTFALDLPPGDYGLVCFVKDADGESHAVRGMNAELRVSPETPSAQPAPAATSVVLRP